MALDQQIKGAIEAATAQLSAEFQARLEALASELGQTAAAEHARALDEATARITGDLASQHEAALAALRAETSEQRELAVAMARTEAAEQHEAALATIRAEAAAGQEAALEALRAELGRHHEAALEALRADLRSQHDSALAVATESARAEADLRQERALAELGTELAAQHESAFDALRAELGAQHEAALAAATDSARTEAESRQEQAFAGLRTELAAERQAALDALRSEFASQHDTAAVALRAQLAAEHEAALAAVRSDADGRVARARTEADELLAHARAEADQRLAAAKAEADASLAQTVEAAKSRAAEDSGRALVDARAAERQAELAFAERLADSVRRLDGARSLTEVLDVLVDASAREVPRVAVFLVRGTKLAGWRAAGFSRDEDPRELEVPLDQAGLLTKAVRSSSSTTLDAVSGEGSAPPFGSLPAASAAVAVPLRVGGETVGVLYADDVSPRERETPSVWPESIDVLSRHACRCLEVVTIARVTQPASIPAKAPSPTPPRRNTPQARAFQAGHDDDDDAARRYARLLVSEIKLYQESAVTAGRRDRNLLDRLREEIDRARRLYDERVPPAVLARTDYFNQELVRTLANGDASLLGPA